MTQLSLSVAMGDYDRTRALQDGSVRIDGVDPTFMLLSPEEAFFRAFRGAEFDVSELSLSSYVLKVAQGDCPYVAVPAFLSRAFRHTAIYVRRDRVRTPADLKRIHSDPPPAAYPGREFSRNERILMRFVIEGQLASTASVSVGLIDRRGKRLTDLPFTRTPAGWLLDLPLQSIARGEYLIGVDAKAGEQHSTAYVPIRVQDR